MGSERPRPSANPASDIAGLLAGAAKMPLAKFFLALFVGKTIKYIAIALIAAEAISLLPFLKVG